MSHDWQAPDAVAPMLDDCETWAVVGLSGDPVVLGEQGYATSAVGARGVWFELGVVDVDTFERTVATVLPMVMDTCPAIEWGRRRA